MRGHKDNNIVNNINISSNLNHLITKEARYSKGGKNIASGSSETRNASLPPPGGGPSNKNSNATDVSIWSGTKLCKKPYGCGRVLNIREYFFPIKGQTPTIYCKGCRNARV